MAHPRKLILRGARAHNLRDLDLALPHDAITVITGVSGSGKSSLAVDALLVEARRRYLAAVAGPALHRLGKLGRARADHASGLRAGVLLGQARPGGGPRSTVGTASGLLDLLRLLLARVGERRCLVCGDRVDRAERCPGCGASAEPLLAGSLSFNAGGACASCRGLGVVDWVDPDLLVADPSRSLRSGALVPTTPKPYIVYTQVTMEVLDTVCRAHGFSVDTPWADLSAEQREVVFRGSQRVVVPFGKHPLESRMRWSGITARPREEGHYKGIVTTIEGILAQKRNPGVLRFVRSVPCEACGGSRLRPAARAVSLGGRDLHAWSALSVSQLHSALAGLSLDDRSQRVAAPLLEALLPRLDSFADLGLGHLAVARPTDSLSGGEARRVQLAGCLAGGLGRLLYVLDEPSAGLHPRELRRLRAVLERLRRQGNTVVLVEHDPSLVATADWLVEVGPGAGSAGGRKLFEGPPARRPERPGLEPRGTCRARAPGGWLRLRGAREHNLADLDVSIPTGCLVGVAGVSGAGKTILAVSTLARAVAAVLGRRGQAPGRHDALEGAEEFAGVEVVDASPIGRSPRSNAATYTKVFDPIRKLFAQQPLARQRGFGATRFSFNTRGGRCERCEGAGSLRVGLHFLADVHVSCEACGGARFDPDTLAVRYRGHSVHDVLEMGVAEALELLGDQPKIARTLAALDDVGLGYLPLGQPATTLSGGEARRVKLATQLARPARGAVLFVLDEPTVGLHPEDVSRLVSVLQGLVDRGHTVVVVDHERCLLEACDHLIELGPGGGELGGRLVGEGRPDQVLGGSVVDPRGPSAERLQAGPSAIRLEAVSTHNLRGFDLEIPHDALTVITGVSGSGKSSLAFDTLHAEAWRRFGSTLPGEARRRLARQPRPGLAAADGLGPSVAVGQRPVGSSPRSVVGSLTGVLPWLRLLWARFGTRVCPDCQVSCADDTCAGCGVRVPQLTVGHLSFNKEQGACPSCDGLGQRIACDPSRLVSHPGRGLWQGAMDGSRIGRHLGETQGQHLATLGTAARELGVEIDRPWSELSEEARQLALVGTGQRIWSVRWHFQRGKRSGEHAFEGPWPGLLALVEQAWDRTHADKRGKDLEPLMHEQPCTTCHGERLAPWPRVLGLGGLRLGQACAMPVEQLLGHAELWVGRRPWADVARGVCERLRTLQRLGLGYLSLDRRSDTLSGGEARRVQLAGLLGADLVGLTCVLDEPGTGLHPRDRAALHGQLRRLADAGNTVVVVEHDLELVRAADRVVELGPGAGSTGGAVVAQGSAASLSREPGSLTGAWLRGERSLPRLLGGRLDGPRLEIEGASRHNLEGLDVSIPTQGLVGVAGVSGSGKSTLVSEVLSPSLMGGRPVHCRAVRGGEGFAGVVVADPRPIGRSPISTPASFTGLLPLLAAHWARSSAAREAGLGRAAFSYTSPRGRCPCCKGLGRETVALELLADAWLPCEACGSARYRPEVLAVEVEGRSIADALAMSVGQALEQFARVPRLGARLTRLVDVGLDYLRLDQPSGTLSGGESRRLRVALALMEEGSEPQLFLLDEPSTGLHPEDRGRLLGVLDALVQRGHTVVMVEHDPGMLARCDHIVELGPEGGPGGGRVVAQGAPAQIAAADTTTGRCVAPFILEAP